MKKMIWSLVMVFVICLAMPQALVAGKGFMGGQGTIVVEEEPPPDTGVDGGMPGTVEGPLNDKMSSQGKLFGDLYKILRYQGSELSKLIPQVDEDGNPVLTDGVQLLVEGPAPTGGEPLLTEGYSEYALEVAEGVYELADAPYPSQCVQPVADFAKWGDIGRPYNTLPLLMTYDATWSRTECEVGELIGDPVINTSTGEFTTPDCSTTVTDDCINRYYEPPSVSCPDGILWVDLVDEVHFGRLNLSRSPEAVLQAAFDEAIGAINSEDTIGISRDAAGRLLLEKNVYSETEVDLCGEPLWIGTTFKAIDSPLENLSLYVKILKDGHLVTPGDERAPIDRSERGGIPLWKMLELSDGPSKALRPTVDIEKLGALDPALVDVSAVGYYTYYECYDEGGGVTDCLCEEISHDGIPTNVACDIVASRELLAVDTCPAVDDNPNAASCEGPWNGIKTDGIYATAGDDFDFAAAFLAAAADKTGKIEPDMVVYINSILGINQVVGYSAYDVDGNPIEGAIDYSKSPVYFSYGAVTGYDRNTTFNAQRGDIAANGDPLQGQVRILQEVSSGTWNEIPVDLTGSYGVEFRNLGLNGSGFPDETAAATENFLGFAQMADDDLSTIKLVHTYQIPGRR